MGHEADHSLPSSAKVKNEWSYTSKHHALKHGSPTFFTAKGDSCYCGLVHGATRG
jgi:hypothetical protein